MNKFTLTGLLVFMTAVGFTQVTFEHSYNYSAAVISFETLGYKYYLMDVPNSECRIYNLDHSLYKSISCSVPSGCYLCDVKYLSQNVFDSDDEIELVFSWYKYVPTTDSYYYEYGSSIINEDGSSIAVIDGARYLYLNQVDENIWKLFVYCYDYSVWPERIWTNIYSLPGTPVYGALPESERNDVTLNAFPNPTAATVKVNYSLPSEVREAVLCLLDNNGKMVRQFVVDNHTDHLLIDVSAFPGGLYHYYLEYNGTRCVSEKLLIQ